MRSLGVLFALVLLPSCGREASTADAGNTLDAPRSDAPTAEDAPTADAGAERDAGEVARDAGSDAGASDAGGDAGGALDAGLADGGTVLPPDFGTACSNDADCAGLPCRTWSDGAFCYNTACTAPCTSDAQCGAWLTALGRDPAKTGCFSGVCDLSRTGLGAIVCE